MFCDTLASIDKSVFISLLEERKEVTYQRPVCYNNETFERSGEMSDDWSVSVIISIVIISSNE